MSRISDLEPWWGSLSLVNAGLAQTKGRSRWNWFLLSLILGPVATLFIVVWQPRTEKKKATATSTTAAATEE
jgi:hypothetical protein